MMNNGEATKFEALAKVQNLLWRDLELSMQMESILPERNQIRKTLRNFPASQVDDATAAICAQLEQRPWQEALSNFKASRAFPLNGQSRNGHSTS